MERREYERLAAAEDRGWWFDGLHRNLTSAWRAAAPVGARRLLDAGCGTGGLLKRLDDAAPGAIRIGIDLDAGACRTAREKSGGGIATASIAQLPFPASTFDAIFSADVLCHRGVDAPAALAELCRCLKPGGVLVLNLPAYQWLYSAHDEAVANAHRYARKEVAALLADAGFRTVRLYYWNSLLFPLMVLRRKLLPAGTTASEVEVLPAPFERIFAFCLVLERAFAAVGLRLPFGGSILAVGVRPKEEK